GVDDPPGHRLSLDRRGCQRAQQADDGGAQQLFGTDRSHDWDPHTVHGRGATPGTRERKKTGWRSDARHRRSTNHDASSSKRYGAKQQPRRRVPEWRGAGASHMVLRSQWGPASSGPQVSGRVPPFPPPWSVALTLPSG